MRHRQYRSQSEDLAACFRILTHESPVKTDIFHWNFPKPMTSSASSTVNVPVKRVKTVTANSHVKKYMQNGNKHNIIHMFNHCKNCRLNVMEGFACPCDQGQLLLVGSPKAKWFQGRGRLFTEPQQPRRPEKRKPGPSSGARLLAIE